MEEYKVLKSTENPFPDDLEGRINAIANVCNSEIKIATLLHLDDRPVDGYEILERIRETARGEIKLGRATNFSAYCNKSLLPIGAVIEEQVKRLTDESIYTGYKISSAGKRYGVPLGIFSLQWAVDNGLSLYSILGSTASSGRSRSPLNRLKVLKLLRKEELRETDLCEKTWLDHSSLLCHLKNLEKIGFISYYSTQELAKTRDNFKYKYTGKEGEPESYRGRPNLTKGVFEFIKGIEDASYQKIAGKLRKNCTSIIGILSHLEKQGFLERVGEFSGRIRSNARIRDIGRRFIDEFYNVWEEALSDRPILNELQNRVEDFFANNVKEYLIKGIANYQKISPNHNAKPIEETNERIITYLKDNPGARPKDIERNLRLSFSSCYLTPLIKSGILEKRKIDEKNKIAIGYFVKGSNS